MRRLLALVLARLGLLDAAPEEPPAPPPEGKRYFQYVPFAEGATERELARAKRIMERLRLGELLLVRPPKDEEKP